jgi:indole-3-acetate monooxygenase
MSTDPVSAVAALSELIRGECRDMDRTRRVPDAVVRALRHAGVFRLLAPIAIGGDEIDPVTFLKVVEAASHADGSVGWCVMIGGCHATFGGMLPDEGARDIYGDPETISAGAFRPGGVAVEVDGGFRIGGRWTLASGSGCRQNRNETRAGSP